MTTRFAGKVALVSGAASGIGAAVVERLVDEGATVVACDVTPIDGGVVCDVRDADACRGRRRRDAATGTAGSTCWPTSPASPPATGSRT